MTEGSGPLSYVRGSHRAAGRKAQLPATWDGYGFRVEDDEIVDHFGADRVLSVPGPGRHRRRLPTPAATTAAAGRSTRSGS